MTTQEAQRILIAYRPDSTDAGDPEVAQALALAGRDPALAKWLENQCAVQAALREKFRQISLPAGIKEQILERRTTVPAPIVWWRARAVLAAAAGITLLLGLAVFWLSGPAEKPFADFRERMVRTALREYRMDVATNSVAEIRRFLASRNGHADYRVTPALEQLPVMGAGLLSWQGQPVSMVCFDAGNKETLFLFVIHRAATDETPEGGPEFLQVSKLTTASWSAGDKAYVLAGAGSQAALRKYW